MSATPAPDANVLLMSCRHSCDHDAGAKVALLRLGAEMGHWCRDARLQDNIKELMCTNRSKSKHALYHPGKSEECGSLVTKTDQTDPCPSQFDACGRGYNRGGTACPTGRNTRNEPNHRQTLALEGVMKLESRVGIPGKSNERSHSSRNLRNSPTRPHCHDGMNQSGKRKTNERSHSSCSLHNPTAPVLHHDGMCLILTKKPNE